MHYKETWNSLKRHRIPEWLDDAKFGLYFHLGPYSVPDFGTEWYPNKMYQIGGEYKYHAETYGEPEDFGYKDFIPLFTGEHFRPKEWAALFKESGAKFAGLVAEHHDGFSMWDSQINQWNAVNMGPKRDIVGEMGEAIKQAGLKFITTFHHAYNWYYFYHLDGLDTGDPKYAALYGGAHPEGLIGASSPKYDRPDKVFHELWFAKLKEVIDNYKPDILWFDFGLQWIVDKYKRKLVAYFYNKEEEWGKEVEIISKRQNLPSQIGLLDYERGRSSKMTRYPWITDTSIGVKSWSYLSDEIYKPLGGIIQNFCDTIVKNGSLLLNFGPTAQGEIPPVVVDRLRGFGKWMEINADAVYNSTPWVLAEEGSTKLEVGGDFSENNEVKYTPEDLRFVVKDEALYVFCLGWPGKELVIKSLSLSRNKSVEEFYILAPSDISAITLLGHDKELSWKLTSQGLVIQFPNTLPCEHVFTIKINWANMLSE